LLSPDQGEQHESQSAASLQVTEESTVRAVGISRQQALW
jgi:hypothetical protein